MNFVMTGHKGLIGSYLLERLKNDGHNPKLLVDVRGNSDGSDRKDIRFMSAWHMGNAKIDVLFHLASFCKIRDCIENPNLAFKNNVEGTHAVMEFCALNKIPKVVFTSSTRVLYPEKNPYTASKIYGEELVKSYGIEYVIVRPSTVYGPFDDLTKRVTHQFIMAALDNKDLIIYGDKNKTLDFTYVDDFIDAIILASSEKNCEFNVGTGFGAKVADVAQLIIDLIGSKSKIIFADAEKLQPQQVVIEATDFNCPTTVEEGMARTVAFWK